MPTGPEPEEPDTGPEPADPQSARRSRIVVLISVVVLALAGLALAFFLGTRLQPAALPVPAPATTSPGPTAKPAPTATLAPVPAGPAAPGVREWDELGGGECLDPFVSAWEREFTVVDCGQPHAAQLVARGLFPGEAGAPYPGEQVLTAELATLCTRPETLDRAAAEQYGDLQWQAAYPADEEQWAEGDRSWFCFVSRTSGEPLTGTLAAPPPAG